MSIVKDIQNNGCRPHLLSNAKATLHGIYEQSAAKAPALLILTHGNSTNIDDRNIGNAPALPFPGAKVSPNSQCAKRVKPKDRRITVSRRQICSHHAVLDVIRKRRFEKVINGAMTARKGASVMKRLVKLLNGKRGVLGRGLSRHSSTGFPKQSQRRPGRE